MTAIRKRVFTRLAGALAFSAIVTGCGSSAPARPAALDPSNPEAQGSPPVVVGRDGAPDSGATPVQHEPRPLGDDAAREKGSR